MDIHKPKPWHNVREFLKEYLIIVIGVLTALGAEQTVEWLHNNRELAETREALHAEVARNGQEMRYAEQEDRCYLKVLDLYEAWAKGGPKPDVPILALPTVVDPVWQSAKTGAVSHMPLKEKFAFGQLYGARGANITTSDAEQHAQGSVVRGYLGLDNLTTAEARDFLRDVRAYRMVVASKIYNERKYIAEAKALGIAPPPLDDVGDDGEYPMGNLKKLCDLVGMKIAFVS